MTLTKTLSHSYNVWDKLFFISEADEDYVAQNTVLSFAACETVKCLDVELLDDCVLEDTETFKMMLSTVSGQDERIKLGAGGADVVINDDDGVYSNVLPALVHISFLCSCCGGSRTCSIYRFGECRHY